MNKIFSWVKEKCHKYPIPIITLCVLVFIVLYIISQPNSSEGIKILNNIFLALDLVSILLLIVAMVAPWLIFFESRKKAGLIFGGSIVLFFILFGITIDSTPPSVTDTTVVQTVTSTGTSTKNVSEGQQKEELTNEIAAQKAKIAELENSTPTAVIPAPQPTSPAPDPTPSAPITLTDSDYTQQLEGTVMSYIQNVGSDVNGGSIQIINSYSSTNTPTDTSNDISTALADFQQGQNDISQAQDSLQTLENETPSDMTKVNDFISQYLSGETGVINLFLADINNNTLSRSQTSNAYAQMNRPNVYLSQANTIIQQQWK